MELYKMPANRQKYQATDGTVLNTQQELKARHLQSEGTWKQLHESVHLGYMRLLLSFRVWTGNSQVTYTIFLLFVVPSIMLYSSEISTTRCNNCVFILRNGFTLHVSGDNLTHHQEYICCIWPQVSRLT